MKRFAMALVLSLASTTAALADNFAGQVTVDQLRLMTQDQLDDVYLAAPAGDIPDGESAGTAVFFPGRGLLNQPTQLLASLIWQGKVFDTDEGILVNKVFGFKAIKAEVFYGESLLDGGDSIIIDYHRTSILANAVRDEIRQLGPNLYLGRAYIRTLLADFMVVNFILQFPE